MVRALPGEVRGSTSKRHKCLSSAFNNVGPCDGAAASASGKARMRSEGGWDRHGVEARWDWSAKKKKKCEGHSHGPKEEGVRRKVEWHEDGALEIEMSLTFR
jgi:hypothetical protein